MVALDFAEANILHIWGRCLRRYHICLPVSTVTVGSTSCLSIPEYLNWGQGVPRKPEESRVARLDSLLAVSPPSATLILLLSYLARKRLF